MNTRSGARSRATTRAWWYPVGLLFAVSCSDSPTQPATEIIALSHSTASFAIDAGDPDPAPQSITVTNSGPGTLSDLGVNVSYGSGQPTGWLSAIFTETTAPTSITLHATTGGGALGPGTYTATVAIASNKANNSPQSVAVTFRVNALYGHYTEFSAGSAHQSNFLLGSRITVPTASMLTHLCLIAKAAGPQVKIGLYSDIDGNPGALIASTLANTLSVGRMEIPVTEVALPPGDYWFMAVYNATASIGIDYYAGPEAVYKFVEHTFSDALPTTFPAPMQHAGQDYNYYLKARVP